MAKLFCDGGTSASKPISLVSTTDRASMAPPVIIDGLVQHETLTPETQIQVFSVIDKKGWCTVGDVIAALPGHPRPMTALTALAAAGVITLHVDRLIDEHTRLTRAVLHDASDVAAPDTPVGAGGPDHCVEPELPPGVATLPTGDLVPVIHRVAGRDRNALLAVSELDRAGVYMALRKGRAYVGMSATSVGRRVALGSHLAGDVPELVLILTDRDGVLDKRLTRSLERLLALVVHDCRTLELTNLTPRSDHLAPEEYDRLRLFVSQFVLACRHAGIAFTEGPTCRLMAGPRTEPGRVGELYVSGRPPGIIHRLQATGVTAYAAACENGSWILLAGSEVRTRTVQSASSTPATLRAEWLHAGILRDATDRLILTRAVHFDSASAAALFVIGAKGLGLAGWIRDNDATLPDLHQRYLRG